MKKKINSIQLQQPALANIMAEQALLAAIIIDNNTMNQAAMLTPSDFYDSRNAEIFAVIKKNYNSKKIIDLTSFVGSGYEDYILELMDLPSALLNVDTYIKEIKENSNKRQIISLTNDFRDSKIKYEDYIESLQKLYIACKRRANICR